MIDDVLISFQRRLSKEWLPSYCNDPRRRYALEGYRHEYRNLESIDAQDFIYALAAGVVHDTGGGRYRAPRSKATEMIFWEGRKITVPRPITLWLEPIISVASAARLHRDYGWPVTLLGLQSVDWAFDLVAYEDLLSEQMIIAGEVKKSIRELELMIDHLHRFADKPVSATAALSGSALNAARKWLALAAARPRLFWAIGPGSKSEAFTVTYDDQGPRSFDAAPLSELSFLHRAIC